ncbi:MAG: amino acid adenylation domain-containing protein [Nitrospirales bacterium]
MIAPKSSSIPKRPEGALAPLSLAQQRLWFLFQFNPHSPEYNISRSWRLQGPLHTSALRTSLNLILARHEALRTTFQETDGQAFQVIHPTLHAPFQELDWSGYPPAQREAQIDRFLINEPRQPFDLLTGPLLRSTLIRCEPDDHVLVFTIHHMVFDGTSLKVFCQEISHYYAVTLANQTSPLLAPLPIQYQDYAYWQQAHVTDEKLAEQVRFWKQYLQGAPLVLELPSEDARTKDNSGPSSYQVFTLAPHVISKLKQLIQPQGITIFMALLAVFQILLSRYTGQRDILVGTPIAGRTHTDLEDLIGFLVNTLVLRIQIVGHPTFHDILRQVRKTCLDAYRHQDLPFEKLVEVLNPVRDPSRSPVVQAIFQFRQASDLRLVFPDVEIKPFPVKRRTGNFDLHMVCEEASSGIEGFLYYPQELYSDSMMANFAQHYRILLEELIANPEQAVEHIPFLTEAERDRQLFGWNDTTHGVPGTKCFHELFEEQVERTPDSIAIVFEHSTLTYTAINGQANQLAHHLRSLGIGPEAVVAIALERSPNLMIGLLGILKAGAAYLPLELANPTDRLAYFLNDSQVSLLLTQQKFCSKFPLQGIRTLYLDTNATEWIQADKNNPLNIAVPDNSAYILYTSGSTGNPKGVMISHRGLVNYLTWCIEAYKMEEGRGTLLHSSIGFDLTITSLFSPLIVGKSVRLLDEYGGLQELGVALQTYGNFNHVKLTPSHLEGLNQLINLGEISGQIGTLILAGEALSQKALLALKPNSLGPTIVNEYGPTETVVGCSVYEVGQEKLSSQLVPIGRPISNMEMYIFDKHLQPMPVGCIGEIFIGGVGVARGYQGRPGLTADKFIPHLFCKQANARLYKSGDLGRFTNDGTIEYIGRLDHQVKIRGFRIELGEIETALAQHPGVQKAIVLCREDSPNLKRLVGYVVVADTNQPTTTEILTWLKGRLPDYMLPSEVMYLSAFPLTPNGKMDRKSLPAQDSKQEIEDMATDPPRTPLEELVAEIWLDIFKVKRISVNDNFFDLGGHSLLATRVIARLREVLELTLPLRIIFDYPTIALMAQAIDTQLTNNVSDWSSNKSSYQS